jgi:hypothetical protein
MSWYYWEANIPYQNNSINFKYEDRHSYLSILEQDKNVRPPDCKYRDDFHLWLFLLCHTRHTSPTK